MSHFLTERGGGGGGGGVRDFAFHFGGVTGKDSQGHL